MFASIMGLNLSIRTSLKNRSNRSILLREKIGSRSTCTCSLKVANNTTNYRIAKMSVHIICIGISCVILYKYIFAGFQKVNNLLAISYRTKCILRSFHHIHLLHCVSFELGGYMFDDKFAVNYWWTFIN